MLDTVVTYFAMLPKPLKLIGISLTPIFFWKFVENDFKEKI